MIFPLYKIKLKLHSQSILCRQRTPNAKLILAAHQKKAKRSDVDIDCSKMVQILFAHQDGTFLPFLSIIIPIIFITVFDGNQ
jgi:hypothetical protein